MNNLDNILTNEKYKELSISVNSSEKVEDGIIFIYCSWSPTEGQLKLLLSTIITIIKKPDLFVYDIDSPQYENLKKNYSIVSQSWGETYWIKNGKIKHKILKYKDLTDNRDVLSYTLDSQTEL